MAARTLVELVIAHPSFRTVWWIYVIRESGKWKPCLPEEIGLCSASFEIFQVKIDKSE